MKRVGEIAWGDTHGIVADAKGVPLDGDFGRRLRVKRAARRYGALRGDVGGQGERSLPPVLTTATGEQEE